VKDIIKFKTYIFDLVDKHEQQKFIKNKNSKFVHNIFWTFVVSARDLQLKQFLAHLQDNNVKDEEPAMDFLY
jgi:hypothetical protein